MGLNLGGGEHLTQGLSQSLTSQLGGKLDVNKEIKASQSEEAQVDANIMEAGKDDMLADMSSAENANAANLRSTILGAKQNAKLKEKEDAKSKVQKNAEGASAGKRTERSNPEFDKAAEALSKKTAGEISAKTLIAIKGQVKDNSNPEDTIKLVESFVSEPYLAHEVLEFLKEESEGKQKEVFEEAFKKFDSEKGGEARKGREIGLLAREMSMKGEGEVVSIRSEINTLMDEKMNAQEIFGALHKTYGSYKQISNKLKIFLHYLGEQTKESGVERPHLAALNSALRNVQAVKQVYAFFLKMLGLIEREAHQVEYEDREREKDRKREEEEEEEDEEEDERKRKNKK